MRHATFLLLLLVSSCSIVKTDMTLPDQRTIHVSAYSFFRQTDADYEATDTKIHYGAQTEAAKLQGLLQVFVQAVIAAAKVAPAVP